VAAQFQKMGFVNVKALKGGINGWKAKGYPMQTSG